MRAVVIAALCLMAGAAHAETCIASVYSTRDHDQNGTRTASGIPLNDKHPSMAHRTLPLRSYATVTHGNRSLTMQITDRGPYKKRRCVDLSMAAARMLKCGGLCKVSVE